MLAFVSAIQGHIYRSCQVTWSAELILRVACVVMFVCLMFCHSGASSLPTIKGFIFECWPPPTGFLTINLHLCYLNGYGRIEQQL